MMTKEQRKVYSAQHYQANKARYRECDHRRKTKVRKWYLEFKQNLKCVRCGESHPGCLEFHHQDPSKKEVTISKAISNRWSPDRIMKEVAKCEVLCSNCHRKLHWTEDSVYQKMWLEQTDTGVEK